MGSTARQPGEGELAFSLAALEALEARLGALKAEQTRMLETNLQHLRELAVLNRVTRTLGHGRTFRQVLLEAAREAARLAATERVWVIEPDDQGRPRSVQTPDGANRDFSSLPAEVRKLYRRVALHSRSEPRRLDPHDVRRQPAHGTDPTADPAALSITAATLHVALPILSAKHLMGVLVLARPAMDEQEQGHLLRLLRSVLGQAGVACENARLAEAMSQMIVEVVAAMAMAVESRDPYTGGHTRRVTAYSLLLGERVGLDRQMLSILRLGSLLHDIGKVAVPDAILQKPGRLTPAEFDVIKTHPVVGYQIVHRIPQLARLQGIVRHHHERFDGGGYPDGLGGDTIPFLARIVAVADTFDAMTSDRSYRRSLPAETALAEIRRCAGTQFDPDLARLFVEIPRHDLTDVARTGADGEADDPTADVASTLELFAMLELNLPRRAAEDATEGADHVEREGAAPVLEDGWVPEHADAAPAAPAAPIAPEAEASPAAGKVNGHDVHGHPPDHDQGHGRDDDHAATDADVVEALDDDLPVDLPASVRHAAAVRRARR